MSDYEEWEDIYRRYPLNALPWERGKPREALVELVEGGGITPGKCLDTCCGAGTNDIYLARKGFEVVAMDISPTAVEYAREAVLNAGVEMEVLVGSFLELEFAPGEFDFVLDSGCFHHVLERDRTIYIEGIRRVLKDGGRYLLICFSQQNGPAWNHFDEGQLRGLFGEHFKTLWSKHLGTVEGDGVVRYFHNMLMEKLR